MKKPLILFTLLFPLAALSQEVMSIDWYMAHDDERNSVIANCNNIPKAQLDQNCVNAKVAYASLFAEKKQQDKK